MVKEIMHDEAFLSQKAELATKEDLYLADDLRDTLEANKEHCVGMAANMIGVNKRVIIFEDNKQYFVMFNPEIIKNKTLLKQKSLVCHFKGTLRKQNVTSPSKSSGSTKVLV